MQIVAIFAKSLLSLNALLTSLPSYPFPALISSRDAFSFLITNLRDHESRKVPGDPARSLFNKFHKTLVNINIYYVN